LSVSLYVFHCAASSISGEPMVCIEDSISPICFKRLAASSFETKWMWLSLEHYAENSSTVPEVRHLLYGTTRILLSEPTCAAKVSTRSPWTTIRSGFLPFAIARRQLVFCQSQIHGGFVSTIFKRMHVLKITSFNFNQA
jgi:hypothetical protein